jgi:hypothetical protein
MYSFRPVEGTPIYSQRMQYNQVLQGIFSHGSPPRAPETLKIFKINAPRAESSARPALVAAVLILLLFFGSIDTVYALELKLGQDSYQIELATTPQQRQLGLMHRTQLGPRQGLLLVYPQAGDHRIWMKNMLIPLRVYWIDASSVVLDVQRLEPCNAEPCAVYAVAGKSQYILELGDYTHPLEVGDRIDNIRGD